MTRKKLTQQSRAAQHAVSSPDRAAKPVQSQRPCRMRVRATPARSQRTTSLELASSPGGATPAQCQQQAGQNQHRATINPSWHHASAAPKHSRPEAMPEHTKTEQNRQQCQLQANRYPRQSMSKARIRTGAALVWNQQQAQPERIKAGQRPSCINIPCRGPKPTRARREPDTEPLALESSRRSVNAEQSDYEPAITQSPSSTSEEPIQSKSSTNQGSAKAQDHARGKPEQRQCRGSQSQCQIERLSRVSCSAQLAQHQYNAIHSQASTDAGPLQYIARDMGKSMSSIPGSESCQAKQTHVRRSTGRSPGSS
ncbi:hypothetical protein BDW60DRAFT_212683 [Aspergillus nidulans var. acristatus]